MVEAFHHIANLGVTFQAANEIGIGNQVVVTIDGNNGDRFMLADSSGCSLVLLQGGWGGSDGAESSGR